MTFLHVSFFLLIKNDQIKTIVTSAIPPAMAANLVELIRWLAKALGSGSPCPGKEAIRNDDITTDML